MERFCRWSTLCQWAGDGWIQSGPIIWFLHHEHALSCYRNVTLSLDRFVSAPFWPLQNGMTLPYFAFADAWLYACSVLPHYIGLCWSVHSRRLTWSSLWCELSLLTWTDRKCGLPTWCCWLVGHYCPSLRSEICLVFTRGYLRNLMLQSWLGAACPWVAQRRWLKTISTWFSSIMVPTVVRFDPWLSMLISRAYWAFWACRPSKAHFFRVIFSWSTWGVKRQMIDVLPFICHMSYVSTWFFLVCCCCCCCHYAYIPANLTRGRKKFNNGRMANTCVRELTLPVWPFFWVRIMGTVSSCHFFANTSIMWWCSWLQLPPVHWETFASVLVVPFSWGAGDEPEFHSYPASFWTLVLAVQILPLVVLSWSVFLAS